MAVWNVETEWRTPMKPKMVHKARSARGPLHGQLRPRIQTYALENDPTDIAATTAYLRKAFPMYQRQKDGPFTKEVARVVQALQSEGKLSGPEQHLKVH